MRSRWGIDYSEREEGVGVAVSPCQSRPSCRVSTPRWNKATPAAKRLQKQLSLTAAGEVALEKTLFEDKDKDADEAPRK